MRSDRGIRGPKTSSKLSAQAKPWAGASEATWLPLLLEHPRHCTCSSSSPSFQGSRLHQPLLDPKHVLRSRPGASHVDSFSVAHWCSREQLMLVRPDLIERQHQVVIVEALVARRAGTA
jgi:hypothetical protein